MLLLAGLGSSPPVSTHQQRATIISQVLNTNFSDPAIFQDSDNTWYAFATNGNGKNVQVVQVSSPCGPWTVLDNHLLPNPGAWSNGQNV